MRSIKDFKQANKLQKKEKKNVSKSIDYCYNEIYYQI